MVDITEHMVGNELVDLALMELDAPDMRIEFPPGTYKIASFTSKSDGIELVAPDGDVTLEVIGRGDTLFMMSGDAWTISGFEFDFRDTRPKQIIATGGGWSITQCVWRGELDWQHPRPAQAIAVNVDYEAGECLIQDCYFPDGGGTVDDEDVTGGYGHAIRTLPWSVGTVGIDRCWFEGWPHAAIDTAESPSPTVIGSCYIKNCTDGLRVCGPAELVATTLVTDGDTTPSAATGRDTMRGWLDGSVSHDREAVYIETCDFVWTDDAGPAGGNPLDDRWGVDQLTVYESRFHNETLAASIAVGAGRADFRSIEYSGSAPALYHTGGFVGDQEFDEVAAPAASADPPIESPPPLGETPAGGPTIEPEVGDPGGSRGRFYDI